MKLITHLVTGACVGTILSAVFRSPPHTMVYLTGLGVFINYVIDLGHAHGRFGPKRSAFTHSALGVLIISVMSTVAIHSLGIYLRVTIAQTYLTLMTLIASGLVHLLLDSLTEGGIYFLWPFKKRRYALAHIDYDDPIANSLAIIAFTLPTLYLLYMYRGVIGEWLVRLGLFR